jgi:2-(1,2-epoxy-1,2-dihydrophenyl)acetyl-CoA isomerase
MGQIIYEEKDGIATIIFNRPDRYNAFDLEMLRELGSLLMDIRKDRSMYGLILTGNGRAFCTGGDLRWVSSHPAGIEKALHELAAYFHLAVMEIKAMDKPVVAAINGIASGGGFSMALACDFRFMERSALMKQGYTSNGLSIDGGGSYTLPRMVGIQRAMEILALDPLIDPQKALSWGMVNEVVEDGRSKEHATQFLMGFRERSMQSFAASKRLLEESSQLPFQVVLERERELLSLCGGSEDGREGIAAFLEKRRPAYNKNRAQRVEQQETGTLTKEAL